MKVGDLLYYVALHPNPIVPREAIEVAGTIENLNGDGTIDVRVPGPIHVGEAAGYHVRLAQFTQEEIAEGYVGLGHGLFFTEQGLYDHLPLVAYLDSERWALCRFGGASPSNGWRPPAWSPPDCGTACWISFAFRNSPANPLERPYLLAVRVPPDDWLVAWCLACDPAAGDRAAWLPAHEPVRVRGHRHALRHLNLLREAKRSRPSGIAERVEHIAYDLHLFADQAEDGGEPEGIVAGYHALASDGGLLRQINRR